jgi:hypothetical protein
MLKDATRVTLQQNLFWMWQSRQLKAMDAVPVFIDDNINNPSTVVNEIHPISAAELDDES